MATLQVLIGPTQMAQCDNCREKWFGSQLRDMLDIEQRLDPEDGIVPAGECPSCGALAYLTLEEENPMAKSKSKKKKSAFDRIPKGKRKIKKLAKQLANKAYDAKEKHAKAMEELSEHKFKDDEAVHHIWKVGIACSHPVTGELGHQALFIKTVGDLVDRVTGQGLAHALTAARSVLQSERYQALYPDARILSLRCLGFLDNAIVVD